MTTATILALTILAAPLALMVAVLGPLLWELYRIDRAADREWARIADAVEAARRDFDRDALALLDTYSAAAAVLAPELIAETEAHLEDVAR